MFGIDDILIGSAISGVLGLVGQESSNDTSSANSAALMNWNSAEAEKARSFDAAQGKVSRDWNAEQAGITRNFNSAQAVASRNWEQMMSNTAHQREMVDLRKAGLNPILAVSRGGASTPSGAMASSGTPSSSPVHGSAASGGVVPKYESSLSKGLSSALDSFVMSNQLKKVRAETEASQAEARRTGVLADNAELEGDNIGKQGRLIDAQRDELISAAKHHQASSAFDSAHAEYLKLKGSLTPDERAKLQAEANLYGVDTALRKWDLPSAEARGSLWQDVNNVRDMNDDGMRFLGRKASDLWDRFNPFSSAKAFFNRPRSRAKAPEFDWSGGAFP